MHVFVRLTFERSRVFKVAMKMSSFSLIRHHSNVKLVNLGTVPWTCLQKNNSFP